MDTYKLIELKRKYGRLFRIDLDGWELICRTLSPEELYTFKKVEGIYVSFEVDMSICHTAVIYPDTWSFSVPGYYSVMSAAIVRESFGEKVKTTYENYRNELKKSIAENEAYSLAWNISMVNPSMSFLELISMPVDRLLEISAMVEALSNTNGDGKVNVGGRDIEEEIAPGITRSQLEEQKNKLIEMVRRNGRS